MLKYSDCNNHRHISDWWPVTDYKSTASGIFDSTSIIVLTDAYIHESNF